MDNRSRVAPLGGCQRVPATLWCDCTRPYHAKPYGPARLLEFDRLPSLPDLSWWQALETQSPPVCHVRYAFGLLKLCPNACRPNAQRPPQSSLLPAISATAQGRSCFSHCQTPQPAQTSDPAQPPNLAIAQLY